MQWEFSAEDVVKGRVGYGLEDFRRDLAQEVRMNLTANDPLQLTQTYNLLYDLCHALATDRDLDDHLAAYAYDPPTCQFLRQTAPAMSANVEMLGAILQRQIVGRVEAGMPLADAVAEVASWHGRLVDGRLPEAAH